MSFQRGPWEIDQWGNIIDATGEMVRLSGVALPTERAVPGDVAFDNKQLVFNAPSLNTIVGKVIDIANNPYITDTELAVLISAMVDDMEAVYVK